MEKEVIATPKAPAAIGPYSQGIASGGLIFVSGQLPVNPATGEIPEGIEAQARQSLENVKAILEQAGSCCCKVVKTTCFLADIADFAVFNKVYAEYFPKDAPARSCFQVGAIPKGAKLEVEAIAVR
ncbi:RidA family protein [Mesosutterella sp. AGMB02718]|uniref:RidA family protein n=1 Tax=Mesosutterella faecium TaxID=2925194 RepID=A0ABT7IT75_9BURK|nr:RidA family protein [Mesosutterella sp. AGMB02718]MDL2060516.1 RidA family protein [Mesosutterella sp. AGMB02718]